MGTVFQARSGAMSITAKVVPVEAAHSMTVVERYHAPVRRTYRILKHESKYLGEELALQMAIKSVNNTVGSEGLVLTLHVYGTLPRTGFTFEKLVASTYQRVVAMRKAQQEIRELFAQCQVRNALQARSGPSMHKLHDMPIGGHVLLYQPERGKWEEPYALMNIDEEDFAVLMPRGVSRFRSTSVKLYRTTS